MATTFSGISVMYENARTSSAIGGINDRPLSGGIFLRKNVATHATSAIRISHDWLATNAMSVPLCTARYGLVTLETVAFVAFICERFLRFLKVLTRVNT